MKYTREQIKDIYNNPDYWNKSPYDGTGYSDVYAGIVDLFGQCIGLPMEGRWNDFYRCRYNNKQVLEVGCARGWLLKDVMDRGGLVAGVDASDYVVGKSALKDRIHIGLIEDGLPFANDSFDIVFAVETLEHLIDLDAGLKEIYRVLRPGGFMYASAGVDEDEGRHVNVMPREDWAKKLEESGFKIQPEMTALFQKHRLSKEYQWNSFIMKKM